MCYPHLKQGHVIPLLICYVWPVLLLGAETWTFTTLNKIEAFEIWAYMKRLKIFWTPHISFKSIKQGPTNKILRAVKILRKRKIPLASTNNYRQNRRKTGCWKKKVCLVDECKGLNSAELWRNHKSSVGEREREREIFSEVIANIY